MGTNVRTLAAKPKRTQEEILYQAAILSGIYASTGLAIINAKNHEREGALRNVRRLVNDQTAEMLRGKA